MINVSYWFTRWLLLKDEYFEVALTQLALNDFIHQKMINLNPKGRALYPIYVEYLVLSQDNNAIMKYSCCMDVHFVIYEYTINHCTTHVLFTNFVIHNTLIHSEEKCQTPTIPTTLVLGLVAS